MKIRTKLLPTIVATIVVLTLLPLTVDAKLRSPVSEAAAPATVYEVTQSDGISLNQAIERVRRQSDFQRLLSADTQVRGNREVHLVKYMTKDGTVRTRQFNGRRR